jgi:putative Holliday junction resolvase
MARIMAIDYGTKKTGIAVTDPLHIVITGLDTVPTEKLTAFLESYFQQEEVSTIVLGMPHHPDGQPAQIAPVIRKFGEGLKKKFPDMTVAWQDESYTSVEAREIILQSGARKKKRRDKNLVDKVSATLILRAYMEANYWSG